MNSRLFFWEILRIFRQSAFGPAFILLAALFIFSALYQQLHLSKQNKRVDMVLAKETEALAESKDLLGQVERGETSFDSMWDDPRGYYTWHRQVIPYPASRLAFMAVGQRDLYNPLVAVGIFKPAEVEGQELANPVPRLLGTFDPAFVLVFLMPLFIIGFSHGIVSRMREAGTLTLLLSVANPTRLLVLKTFPRFFILTGLVLLCFLVSMAAAGIDLATNSWAIGWICAAIIAYALFFFLAALVLDLHVRSSRSHALALIGLWAVVCILLPTTISTFSKEIFPLPSGVEMTNAIRLAGVEKRHQAQEIMAKYYEDHPEYILNAEEDQEHKGFFDYYRGTLSLGFAVEEAVKPIQDRFAVQKRQQHALEKRLAIASPSAIMTRVLEMMAGSSSGQYNTFEDAIAAFSREWRTYFQRKAFAGDLIGSEDLSRFPIFQDPFHHRQPTPLLHLGILALFDLLLIMIIVFQLRRRGALALLRGDST